MFLLLGNSVVVASVGDAFYAFQRSDYVGQAIVVFLFCGSIFAWTIMVDKAFALRRSKKNTLKFAKDFRGERSLARLTALANGLPGPVPAVFESGVAKLKEFQNPDDRTRGGELGTVEIEAVRSALERSVADQILELEKKIGYLAIAVSVCPFFGLFGTVWGVMVAFCGMASKGRADIAAIAPGVSGALLTTVVGLLVAIPSLIGYNLLTNTIRQLTVYMDNFVEEFMARIKLGEFD
jgi:biopolymer transport protein TolQ